jgi:hypothetical protein
MRCLDRIDIRLRGKKSIDEVLYGFDPLPLQRSEQLAILRPACLAE